MASLIARIPPVFYLLGVVVLLLAGRQWLFSWHEERLARGEARPVAAKAMHATVFPEPGPMPDFSLTDHHGRPFTRDSLLGQWTFLVFGYTHCPDVCPTVLATLNEVKHRLARRADSVEQPAFVFVSLDPGRDSVEQLAAYLPRFSPDFLGAAGPEQQTEALTRQLGVLSQQRQAEGQGGDYLIDHTSAIFLVGPRGLLRALSSPPHDAATIAADYRRITAMVSGQASSATWRPAPR